MSLRFGPTVVAAFLGSLVIAAGAITYAESASEILEASGVRGGLVIHLGAGDGKLTAALGSSHPYLVQGLEADAKNVEAARDYIHAAGQYGRVSVEAWSGETLPYIDNLANLVVAEDLGRVSMDEVIRVLAPGGVAYVGGAGQWTKTVKGRPQEIDEWTHYLHDATGNAVAEDSAVGPPRQMQWLAEPIWTRSHHTLASISALVSTGGRIFYIVDEGPSASIEVGSTWFVAARDAFNGTLLWKRPISTWAFHRRKFRSGPVQLPRTLVAEGNRVYVPLGISAPVSILDAADGQVLSTCEETEGAEEIVLSDGVLLVVTGAPVSEQSAVVPARGPAAEFANEKSIVAIDAETGGVLWRWSAKPRDGELVPVTLAASQGRAVVATSGGVICLDAEGGQERWRWSSPPAGQAGRQRSTSGSKKPKKGAARSVGWAVATLVLHADVVLYSDGKRLSAISAATGDSLWDCPCSAGFKSPGDVFVIGGLVWTGPDFAEGRDLRTGQVKKTNTVLADLRTAGHHHRCYREKATSRYILSNYRGIEFVDLEGDEHSRNNWIRGVCQYGVMPCNGLIYAPSHACGCYMEGKLYGFWAVTAQREKRPQASGFKGARLQRGPAYGQVSGRGSGGESSDSWPTYRHDPARSGTTAATIPASLGEAWQTSVGGQVTPPVVGEGIVVVSSVDVHRVVALDARDGTERWTFVAGGRVDSPPTLYRGLVLFGSADGFVYCLRASDGRLVWRFQAAPEDQRTVVRDQVESIWPVHGSVLVENGVAYATAGRYSYLDGGIRLYGLDPATGRIVCEGMARDAHPKSTEGATDGPAEKFVQNAVDAKTFNAPDRSDAFSMSAARSDVLVGDGESIYLRHLRFDLNLSPQETRRRHLFSTSRLLDDAENHRSHWVMGSGDFSRLPVAYSWVANRPGGARNDVRLSVPYGVLLTYDRDTVWGIRRGRPYRLFAEPNGPVPEEEQGLADFRKVDMAAAKTSSWTWSVDLAVRPRAMVLSGDRLLLAGMPDGTDPADPYAAFEGRTGGVLEIVSAADGSTRGRHELASPPVWNGLAVAGGRLYLATTDGSVVCLGEKP